uniref:Uncharacterized protein n=1 Tax=Anopheles quadriannulatus TaxID=34691 RepID=A0A182XRD0_ANOQN
AGLFTFYRVLSPVCGAFRFASFWWKILNIVRFPRSDWLKVRWFPGRCLANSCLCTKC